jgi:hypothetical protein
MTISQEYQYDGAFPSSEGPFAEAMEASPALSELIPWSDGTTPFTEAFEPEAETVSPAEALVAEALEGLRDEGFTESLADLVAETEAVIATRFDNEGEAYSAERERLGQAHLAPLAFEAERYIQAVSEGLAGTDVTSYSAEQLDEALSHFDPTSTALSPASENFLGGWISKVKGAVKSAVNTAKGAVKAVGSTLLGPLLKKLLGLVKPLLDRVLKTAIGKLPAPLQGPAQTLIGKLGLEAEAAYPAAAEMADEFRTPAGSVTSAGAQPTVATDVEALAEQFDTALAEIVGSAALDKAGELEGFADEGESEEPPGGPQLERLAEARGQLIDAISRAQEGEDLTPAVENFIPVLMAALRTGLSLIGRQRVVNFLAKYLAKLIGKFVGPETAAPLSSAIVDAGLKLLSLEAEGQVDLEAVPTMLAATVEDTVRRVSEQEGYVLDNEDLLQLATAEAFEHAVATNFPPRYVKPAVQQAPSLGGHFRTRRPRSAHPHRHYSKAPEIDLTAQVADSIHTFGGATLGDALRAQGVTFPVRARIHIYQAVAGTTSHDIATAERGLRHDLRTSVGSLHPLTPHAAGTLLREPRLGVHVPDRYLAGRGRLAIDQRLYRIEPVAGPPSSAAKPSVAKLHVDLAKGEVRARIYLAEAEAQRAATAVRQGRGVPALLDAIGRHFAKLRFSVGNRSVVIRTERPESEDLAASVVKKLSAATLSAFERAVRGWILKGLAAWAKTGGEAFARAAADPAVGVTVTVALTAVPGLSLLHAAVAGTATAEQQRALSAGTAFQGAPATTTVTVVPGRHLR